MEKEKECCISESKVIAKINIYNIYTKIRHKFKLVVWSSWLKVSL